MALAENGTATETSEERVNCDLRGRSPNRRGPGIPGKAHVRLTVRKIAVWERAATESITKKTIAKGSNDIIPNYIAGGMDAIEGAYVWNYTLRNCPEEEWEELYKGKLGILDDGGVTLGKTNTGQKAWLRLEKGVTICGRRMRRTPLPHVNRREPRWRCSPGDIRSARHWHQQSLDGWLRRPGIFARSYRHGSNGCQGRGDGDKHGCQNVSPVHLERTRAVDDSSNLGHGVPDNHHAKQVGSRMGAGSRGDRVTGYRSKSRRSQPSHRRGRDKFQRLVKYKQREEHGTGLATPAVQWGSVPRRLFFTALQ
jgi:hypothetical protein